jgi:hypothetical protein
MPLDQRGERVGRVLKALFCEQPIYSLSSKSYKEPVGIRSGTKDNCDRRRTGKVNAKRELRQRIRMIHSQRKDRLKHVNRTWCRRKLKPH